MAAACCLYHKARLRATGQAPTQRPGEIRSAYLKACVSYVVACRVYHRLEELTSQDDEEEVSQEFLRLLGTDKLSYVQLVNQLIVAEETMHLQHAS